MALTPDQIKLLLAKDAQPKRKGRAKKNEIDTTDRSVLVWFKLMHKLFDEESPDGKVHCHNPNCPDTRERQMVAKVNGVDMCRRCFLDGYMLIPETQLELSDAEN